LTPRQRTFWGPSPSCITHSAADPKTLTAGLVHAQRWPRARVSASMSLLVRRGSPRVRLILIGLESQCFFCRDSTGRLTDSPSIELSNGAGNLDLLRCTSSTVDIRMSVVFRHGSKNSDSLICFDAHAVDHPPVCSPKCGHSLANWGHSRLPADFQCMRPPRATLCGKLVYAPVPTTSKNTRHQQS
jgi:hypothetical protein